MVKYETGEDLSGSKFLDEPGKYHMVVEKVDWPFIEDGCKSEKTLFQITLGVLCGPAGTKGKAKRFKISKPHSDDNTDFKRKRVDRFLLACGFIGRDGTNKTVEFEPEDWIGRQLCILLVSEVSERDGKAYLQINFNDIFHVDDPEASSYPKDAKYLSLIPKSQRWGDVQPEAQVPADDAGSF